MSATCFPPAAGTCALMRISSRLTHAGLGCRWPWKASRFAGLLNTGAVLRPEKQTRENAIPEIKNIISGPFCFLLRPLEFFQNFVESRRYFSAGIQNVFLPFSGQRTENVLCPAFFPRHVFYEFSKMADRLRVLLFFARIHPQWLDQQFVQDKSL